MADKVLWETADAIDEQSLQEALYDGITGFVVEGLDPTVSDIGGGGTNIDIPRGHAILVDDSFTPPRAVHAFADARSNVSLPYTSNHIYLVVDQSADEDISYTVTSSATTPSDPHVRIAIATPGTPTVLLYNRNPERSVQAPHSVYTPSNVEMLNVSEQGTVDHFGNVVDRAVPDRVTRPIRDPRM